MLKGRRQRARAPLGPLPACLAEGASPGGRGVRCEAGVFRRRAGMPRGGETMSSGVRFYSIVVAKLQRESAAREGVWTRTRDDGTGG